MTSIPIQQQRCSFLLAKKRALLMLHTRYVREGLRSNIPCQRAMAYEWADEIAYELNKVDRQLEVCQDQCDAPEYWKDSLETRCYEV